MKWVYWAILVSFGLGAFLMYLNVIGMLAYVDWPLYDLSVKWAGATICLVGPALLLASASLLWLVGLSKVRSADRTILVCSSCGTKATASEWERLGGCPRCGSNDHE